MPCETDQGGKFFFKELESEFFAFVQKIFANYSFKNRFHSNCFASTTEDQQTWGQIRKYIKQNKHSKNIESEFTLPLTKASFSFIKIYDQ